MKTLPELQMEVSLGMYVYPTTHHDVFVFFAEGWYVFARSEETPVEQESVPGSDQSYGAWVHIGAIFDEKTNEDLGGGCQWPDGYETFQALLADWPDITSQPVWTTIKTPERLEYEKQWQEEYERKAKEWRTKQHQDMVRGRIEGVFPYNFLEDFKALEAERREGKEG